MTTDCDRLAAMSPAMALGALDPDDAVFARAHVASCPRAHPELREALAIAAALGSALPDPDRPSPSVRGRLLSQIRAEATQGPGARAVPALRGAGTWRWVFAATASLAIAATLALAVQLGENRALDARLTAADARLAAIEIQADATEAWVERAVARGAEAFFMDGEGEAQEASFMLVVEERAAGAVLLMSGLPALAEGETYELWVERDGSVVGVGTFRPDDRGLAAMMIDASLTGIRQALITIEPLGGSDAPSVEHVIMEGELSV